MRNNLLNRLTRTTFTHEREQIRRAAMWHKQRTQAAWEMHRLAAMW